MMQSIDVPIDDVVVDHQTTRVDMTTFGVQKPLV